MERRQKKSRKPEMAAKRSQFATRIRAALREQLEAAAQENGRSLSEEAEMRLEMYSFLEKLVGPQALRAMAAFMTGGQQAAVVQGHPEWLENDEWQRNESCFETAVYRATQTLWQFHPTKTSQTWRESQARMDRYLSGLFGVTGEGLTLSSDYEAGQRDREEPVTAAIFRAHDLSYTPLALRMSQEREIAEEKPAVPSDARAEQRR